MSITLTPDQQRVIEEAIDAGLVRSVDEFIETAVKALPVPDPNELPFEEWMRRFTGWVTSHAGNTVVLPNEAMERESIYGDHGR
jgi:hypothetical protein